MTAALGANSRWHPTWTAERELMDEPVQDLAALRGNLADLALTNRWLGGNSLTLQAMGQLIKGLPSGATLDILDVATGGADIPTAALRWAVQRRLRPRIVATDLSTQALAIAAQRTPKRAASLRFAAADARRLPFEDASFDIAMCSLALHHMVPPDAVAMLHEMGRVARRGVIVNDILRCWHGYLGGWLFGRLLTRNPLTRHDAPLSFRRAYTRDEMLGLAAEAGLGPVRFVSFFGFRTVMVLERSDFRSSLAQAA